MLTSLAGIRERVPLLWRTAVVLLLLGTGALVALTARQALGTHGGSPQTIHACVNISTGQTRIMLPGQAPNCSPGMMLVEWESDTGGIVGGVSRAEITFTLAPGAIGGQGVSCPNANEELTGGGVGAAVFGESHHFIMHESGPFDADTWHAVVQNLDLVNSRDATAYVLCVPTS